MSHHHLEQMKALEDRILHLEKSKRVRTIVTLGLVGATAAEKLFPSHPLSAALGLIVNAYWVWGM